MLPRPQAAASGIRVEHPPSPRQDTWGRTQAALYRLNPRLDHLRSAYPSQGKAPGRSEHSGAAAATLGTLGSSLEHPTPRNPWCRSSNPKHIVSRRKCLWNTFSMPQEQALEQNVASLQWESFHHHHLSSGTSRGESYSCCKNSDRPFCLHHFSSIVYHRNLSKIILYIFIYIYV